MTIDRNTAALPAIVSDWIAHFEEETGHRPHDTSVQIASYAYEQSQRMKARGYNDRWNGREPLPFSAFENAAKASATGCTGAAIGIAEIVAQLLHEYYMAGYQGERQTTIPAYIEADFAMVCKGDSMVNARIFDGDVVYIRRQDIVRNGEIAAVLIDEEATLARVYLFDDYITLEPANPLFRSQIFTGEDMQRVRVIGKVVACTTDME